MLRAIRFSAQLNFEIEEETLNAIKKLKDNIIKISKERIREEFNKIIIYNPRKLIFKRMWTFGIYNKRNEKGIWL